jgi:hypothetical protein
VRTARGVVCLRGRHHGPRAGAVCGVGAFFGFVANFAQEVEKGQLPLSVKGLSGQGVEQFGRSEAFVFSL